MALVNLSSSRMPFSIDASVSRSTLHKKSRNILYCIIYNEYNVSVTCSPLSQGLQANFQSNRLEGRPDSRFLRSALSIDVTISSSPGIYGLSHSDEYALLCDFSLGSIPSLRPPNVLVIFLRTLLNEAF